MSDIFYSNEVYIQIKDISRMWIDHNSSDKALFCVSFYDGKIIAITEDDFNDLLKALRSRNVEVI